MKALITGGAGFIGSHTADLLLSKGYSVRVLDSLEPPVHPDRRKPDYLPDDVEFILGDVRDKDAFRKALKGVDFVFHLAAHQGYRLDFSRFTTTNEGSTALLYELIVADGLPVRKVILGSSQAVYGEGKHSCREHGVRYPSLRPLERLNKGIWDIDCPHCRRVMTPLRTDESRVNPHNQYAVSKYCQELYALTLGRRFNVPTVVMRYSITQGPRQSFYNAYSGILRIFATRLLNKQPPVIYEDGRQLRDYVYVGDVARANLLVMEREDSNSEVYNVGGIQAISVLEYANLLAEISGHKTKPLIKGQFRYGDTRHIISDTTKLRLLGWQPEVPLEQIIKKYLAWLQGLPGVSDHYAEAENVLQREGVLRSGR